MKLPYGFRVLPGLLLAFSIAHGQTTNTSDNYQTAKVVSVRQLKQTSSFPMSRYPTVARFTIDLAFRIADQAYCTGYETPVLDEVQDLVASNGQNVKVEMRGKKITVVLPSGRRIRAELVKQTQC